MARWLALIVITQQISCGGGTSSNPSANVDPRPVASINISPSSAQIVAGASLQFTAIVQNVSNGAVNWQVNGIPGGNSSFGTIAASSAATASYTAPSSVSSALTVTVTAVLQADATKSASASVTINPSPGPDISVSPTNANVVAGGSLQFNATIQNGPPLVIWEVNGLPGGSAQFGRITSTLGLLTALYTAPAVIPSTPVVTITAVFETNPPVSASTNLTIVPPAVSVSISPSTANLVSGETLQFSAIVQNSIAPVSWQVNGLTGGSPAYGTIVATGTSTATYSAPSVAIPLTISVTAVLQANPPLSASAGVTVVPLNTFTGVYSWRNDNSLTGQNAQETILTPSSVSSTTAPTFGKLLGCPVDGQIFAQPLYAANVTIANVTHNVVYVATEHDTLYAFDADASSCQILWQLSFVDPVVGVTTVPATDIPSQTDIVPEIGITGTPVIDPTTATLYVVAKTRVLQSGVYAYKQQLHALDLTTGWVGGVVGAEKYGAPSLVQVPSGNAFDSLTENQRSALLLAGSRIYVAFDSYGDTDPFHGWLFAYDAANLQTAPAVFNTTPNGSHGGIGQSGAAPSVDSSGNVFVATFDGTFDANSGGNDYAETLLKLQINAASFSVADSFTPWNQKLLQSTGPFGSTGVMLVPSSAGGAVPLAIAGSEAGSLYLLDRNNLGGFTPGGPDNVVQTLCLGASLTGTPAYWVSNNTPTIYVAPTGDSLKAFPLANGTFGSPSCSSGTAIPASNSADTFPFFGASPVVSSNGSTSGIVWALDTSGYAISAPAILHAYDAANLANELYASPSNGNGAAGLAVKFTVPTVANGKVYVGTQNELSVFGLQ